MTDEKTVVEITQQYYDSPDADAFYHRIWGGEDIHIGIYMGHEPIKQASKRTVKIMADLVDRPLDAHTRVLDIGAGYGGAARYLAQRFGCKVVCLNLSEVENERNRQKNAELGLDSKIQVLSGNFEAIPLPDASFDLVWSEDALLHSANREQVFREVDRVLRPGGEFIFTDPMMADDCPPEVLGPVLDRIHLPSMGAIATYTRYAERLQWEALRLLPMPTQLPLHYMQVQTELRNRYDELKEHCSEAYLDQMISGLQHWIDAGNRGHLTWGILHYRSGLCTS